MGFADMKGSARSSATRVSSHSESDARHARVFQLKHRMMEFLATEMGFTISPSSQHARGLSAQRLRPPMAPGSAALLRGMYFWTWNTEEVLDMINWMREFNARKGARAVHGLRHADDDGRRGYSSHLRRANRAGLPADRCRRDRDDSNAVANAAVQCVRSGDRYVPSLTCRQASEIQRVHQDRTPLRQGTPVVVAGRRTESEHPRVRQHGRESPRATTPWTRYKWSS